MNALRIRLGLLAMTAASASVAATAATNDETFPVLRKACAAARANAADAEATRTCARLLADLGGHFAAGALQPPASLDERAAQAVEWVRWGSAVPPADPSLRFADTDRALALLDGLIAEAKAQGRQDLLVVLRSDRAVALRDRKRWQDCVDEIEGLRAAGSPVRAYARHAEADALLALRKPRLARAAYDDVLQADRGNRGALVGRFYAEVEDEDFAAAFATIDELGRGEERYRRTPDGGRAANGNWLDAQVLALQARHYAGMNAEAWARIEPLLAGAPALGYLRAAAGSIAAARGWPRRADEEIGIAAGLAPEDIGIAVALAESRLRRRDLPAARSMARELARSQPGEEAVLRLTRELAEFDSATWQLDVRGRQESGGAAAAPGPGYEFSGRLWSAPLADAWRLFAGAGMAAAKPPEGRAERRQAGAGLEWRGGDVTAEASAWANDGTLSRGGMAGSVAWSPDDHWAFGADYERFSRETPLRALLYGVTANGGGISAGYAWHESRAVWAGARHLDFTDGNLRRQVRLAWAERLAETPTWKWTLRPEAYTSSNTRVGAPYFNPSRDLALSASFDADGIVWREYEASLRHKLGIRAGRYRQEGYADGWIGGVSYEQTWQPDTRFEVRYGLEYGRARYDGVGENVLVVFLTASGRF